jgi:hypothetical protein
MSNSPKYTVIDLAAERTAAERAAAVRRAAARRERQQRRDEEFRRLRTDRAGRAAERERAVIIARLDAVSALVAAAPAGDAAAAGEASALTAEIAALRGSTGSASGTGLTGCLRDAERLRDRALALSGRAQGAAGQKAGRTAVPAALRERLGTPDEDAARLDPAGYRRCADLLDQLDAAAGEEGIRFEALRGTAEHAITGYTERGSAAAAAARAARDEAADLLAALGAATRSAAADARELHDDDLSRELETALASAEAALATARRDPGAADGAVKRARELATALTGAEARLDELAAAYERRAAFAETLKDVLTEHGMSLLGTSETRDRFILRFERPGGALYTAAVDDGENDELMLSYAIDGEADIPVLPEPGQAVCDQTEAFLEVLHADLAPGGYHAGELLWEGKPGGPRGPRTRRARTDSRRHRTLRESR